jgi:murein DD-endopeptidase MepM/ murein hydrolase activator NlpD
MGGCQRQLRLPERFAIDFIRLDQEDRLFSGPIGDLKSYRYYGVPVLSVADGTVVGTHDGEPEQVPPNFPPPFDPETAPGNWMVVDIGDGHFVLYAHLGLHSLTAKVGQRVRRGTVIGRLGNTGSSSAPHLHFQVMDSPSPSAANGLPYEFARFTSRGTVTDSNALFAGQITPTGAQLAGTHRHELPLNLQVVDFG